MHADPSELFEYRCTALEDFARVPTVLGVYDAGATIRQLLVDENPLVDIVNRHHRVRLSFAVNTLPAQAFDRMAESHTVIYSGPALSPTSMPQLTPRRHLTRDQFFREPVLLTAWHRVSVREFVLFAAQKAGGVHFDVKPDSTTDILNRFLRPIDSDDRPIFGRTMVAIAEIVLNTVLPLRALLTGANSAT